MQIDIAESLVASWLRHVKGCQIVETNWRVPSWDYTREKNEKMTELYEIFKEYDKKNEKHIFGENEKLTQIIKQCEVDVVGVKFGKGEEPSMIAADVAFHAKGLNYGGGNMRCASHLKVISKIIRSLLSLYAYFGLKNLTLIFASPLVNNKTMEEIKAEVDGVLRCIRDIKGFQDLKIQTISNGEFKTEILEHTLEQTRGYTNTKELFLRACQLTKCPRDAFGKRINEQEQKQMVEDEKSEDS